MARRSCALSLFVALLFGSFAAGQVAILTEHNDNYRTGQNTNETILAPANLNKQTFGKLFSLGVDGYVYAQPLYVPGVNIPSKGTHNVLYVATEHDSLYAFDADSNTGANANPLWQISFINPGGGINVVTSNDVGCSDLVPEIGITGTPVIDLSTKTIYLVTKTKENGNFVQRLHAIDITTGTEKFGGPITIQGQFKGNADGSKFVKFDPLREAQRPGLALQNGVLYIGWASHCDIGPYHGWVMTYDAATLQQTGIWNSTPNGGLGGVWQAGTGLAIDSRNFLFFATGNGTFDTVAPVKNVGDSVVKMGFSKLGKFHLIDYFTPHDEDFLEQTDTDLGSGGVLVLPDKLSRKRPYLMVQSGKEGTIYLINRNKLGHFNASDDSQIVQSLPGAVSGLWSVPAFWNNHIYFGGQSDNLKMFDFDPVAAQLSSTPVSNTGTFFGYPGTVPVVSANGTTNGIVWAIQTDRFGSNGPAVLHAYDATDLNNELYNTQQNASRDNPGGAVKFSVPTVANGKVYVGAVKQVSVYGLF